jgi:hypothetical protein
MEATRSTNKPILRVTFVSHQRSARSINPTMSLPSPSATTTFGKQTMSIPYPMRESLPCRLLSFLLYSFPSITPPLALSHTRPRPYESKGRQANPSPKSLIMTHQAVPVPSQGSFATTIDAPHRPMNKGQNTCSQSFQKA